MTVASVVVEAPRKALAKRETGTGTVASLARDRRADALIIRAGWWDAVLPHLTLSGRLLVRHTRGLLLGPEEACHQGLAPEPRGLRV